MSTITAPARVVSRILIPMRRIEMHKQAKAQPTAAAKSLAISAQKSGAGIASLAWMGPMGLALRKPIGAIIALPVARWSIRLDFEFVLLQHSLYV